VNRLHKTILRSVFIGLVSSTGLLLLYFILIGLLQSWAHAAELLRNDYLFVGAISVGFGTQLGLYSYVRSVKKMVASGRLSVLATSGTGTSSFSMVACCLHHLGDVMPLIGFSGATLFFEQYRYPLMGIGIAINILTIISMLRLIDKNRLWPRYVLMLR